MSHAKPLNDWLAERGMTLEQLIEASNLDDRVVKAIAQAQLHAQPGATATARRRARRRSGADRLGTCQRCVARVWSWATIWPKSMRRF